MFVVADGDNARSKRQQAVEVLSLHVFRLADTGGKLITRRLVTERLASWQATRTSASAACARFCRS